MIDLQTTLLITGIVVFIVIAIVSYDRYKSSRKKEEASETEIEEGNSIVRPRRLRPSFFDRQPFWTSPTAGRMEPQIESLPEDQEPPESEVLVEDEQIGDSETIRERMDTAAEQPAQEVPQAPEVDRGDLSQEEYNLEDELPIELVARIPGDNTINRDTVLGIYRQFEFDIKKQHKIFGLLHPDKKWCNLERQPESAQFTDVGIAVQLADRAGAITESELNHFSQMVLRFAEVFGRRFKFSISLNHALEYARKLDEFCKNYDAVAILNVVARNGEFKGSDIHRCARDMGLLFTQRSIYEKRHPNVQGGELYYSLASLQRNGELPSNSGYTTNGITLFMNIPRSENPPQVFNDMVADAKELCKRLDGKLVDQNLRGMTQKGLKRIGQQIRQIAQEMESKGVLPGSDKTMRLF